MIDSFALVFLEWAIIMAAIFGIWRDRRYRIQRMSDGASIKRGSVAMAYFSGAFAVSTAVLCAIPMSVEAAEGFRIPLVALNTIVPAYFCFFNAWFRNKFLGWVRWVSENVES